MAQYLYVFAVRNESPNLADVEKTAATRGTPPKKRLTGGPSGMPPDRVRPVSSKFSSSPSEPDILFFTSRVYETDDPETIDLGPLTRLLELSDDWVLLQL